MELDTSQERVDDLLMQTSRTFALTIPILPMPLRREVGVGYLLFRILDTFEDGDLWPRGRRREAITEFSALLRSSNGDGIEAAQDRWLETPPVEHEGYLRLLAGTSDVLGCLRGFSDSSQAIITRHLERTAVGMMKFLDAMDESGKLILTGVRALREYCYAVAGIVGEMLTELFVQADSSLNEARDDLYAKASRFGEGLQLVNILKDARPDSLEGRQYLPEGVPRSTVLNLAREDLGVAAEYVRLLETRGRGEDNQGVVGFCALPVLLAKANLDLMETTPDQLKLSRAEVLQLANGLHDRLLAGEEAIPSLG